MLKIMYKDTFTSNIPWFVLLFELTTFNFLRDGTTGFAAMILFNASNQMGSIYVDNGSHRKSLFVRLDKLCIQISIYDKFFTRFGYLLQ